MPKLREVAEHCRARGARAVFKRNMAMAELRGFAHAEDAAATDIVWHRRGPVPSELSCGALVSREVISRTAAPLVVTSDDPRGTLRSIIEAFFTPQSPCIQQAAGCNIAADVVIGAAGQGYDWRGDHWSPFPHVGGVRIGPGVDISPCARIMRGSIGDTVISEGCKIGNGVNIGHDTRVGPHTLIVAGAQIAGWVRVGRRVKVWQGALVRNGVRIGDEAQIGMGAVVLDDVPSGQVWAGNPATRIR